MLLRSSEEIYEDGVAIVRLTDIDEDELFVTCTATNLKGSSTTDAILLRSDWSQSTSTTSSGINQKPHFVVPLKNIETTDTQVTLKCLVSGTPIPDVVWLENGTPTVNR